MKSLAIIIIVFLSAPCYSISFSQTVDTSNTLINLLITDIEKMQVKEDGEFYKGMFPSFRECGGAPHNYQPDNTIFFTAIAAFALQNLAPDLPVEQQRKVNAIKNNCTLSYPLYKNKSGLPYYGFWPTDGIIMPHTFVFKYLKGVFGQGEDADDSVIILMTDSSDTRESTLLKQQLIKVSNLANASRKIISTYKHYREYSAYSTYLGTRMPPDFDFAVHCNILYFMYEKKLSWTTQDSATLHLVEAMVRNRDYMINPVFISPYYVHSEILLYHLTRLMAAHAIPELEMYKPQLIADIYRLLQSGNNVMDQIILRTSLLRLGENPPDLLLPSIAAFEKSNQNKFVFFQARAAFPYPVPLKKVLLHWSYIYYYFYCPAYNKILWLEYLVEKQKYYKR